MGLFSPLISFFSSCKCKANNNTKSSASITPPLDNNNGNQYLETPDLPQIQQPQFVNNQEQQPEPLPLSQQQQQPEGASLNQQQRQKPDPSLNQQPSPVNSNAVIPSTSSSLQNHQQQTVNDNVNPVVQSGDKNDDPTIKGVTELGSRFLKDFGRLMDRAELDAQKILAQMLKADKKQTTTTSTLQNQRQTPVNNNLNLVVKSGDKKNDPTQEGVMELRKSFLQDIDQLMNTVLFLERVTEMGNNFFQEFDQLMYRVQLDTDKSLSEIKDVVSCMQAATKKTTRKVNAWGSGGTPTTGESCKIESKLEEVDAIISTIVGLEGVKLQMRKWVKGLLLYEKRKTLGIKVGTRKALHMVFLGNPGTGKTMCARILGKVLHRLGLTSTDKVTEVQRTDLVAEYLGQTGPKAREKILEAKGGILFVDEAYRLMPCDTENDFGKEAIEEIMSAMDNEHIVAIFAGYSNDMERVISSNEGFSRRVSKIFHFDDYSPKDIAMILQSKMNSQYEGSFVHGFKLHPDCTLEAVARLIKEHTTEELLKTMNGGLVEPLLVNALENLDLRSDMACSDADTLTTITMEDLEEGLKSLPGLKEKDDRRYLDMYC